MMDEKLAVSVNRAAELIGLGRDVTYRLVMSGDVPSFKVGARRLVPVAGLREYVERRAAESGQGARRQDGATVVT